MNADKQAEQSLLYNQETEAWITMKDATHYLMKL